MPTPVGFSDEFLSGRKSVDQAREDHVSSLEQSSVARRGFDKLTDWLSRGTYASAQLAHLLFDDKDQSFYESLRSIKDEFVRPTYRRTYSDVLKELGPEALKNSPVTAGILGFVLDVALDPLTYLGTPAFKLIGKGGRSAVVNGSKLRSFLKDVAEVGGKGAATAGEVEARLLPHLSKMGVDNPAVRGLAEHVSQSAEEVNALRHSILDASKKRLSGWQKLADKQDRRLFEDLATERFGGVDNLTKTRRAELDELVAKARRGNVEIDSPILARYDANRQRLQRVFKKEEDKLRTQLREAGAINQQRQALLDKRFDAALDKTAQRIAAPRTLESAVAEVVTDSPVDRAREYLLDNFSRWVDDTAKETGAPLVDAFKHQKGIYFHLPFTDVYAQVIPLGRALDAVRNSSVLKGVRTRLRGIDKTIAENASWYRKARLKLASSTPARLGKALPNYVRQLFDRDYALAPEFREAQQALLTAEDNAVRRGYAALAHVFGDLGAASREKIGKVGQALDDAARRASKDGTINTPAYWSTLQSIRQEAKLSTEEWAAYGRMRQSFKEMAEVEQASGLLEHTIANYLPRVYEMIGDPKTMLEARRKLATLSSVEFGPGMHRTLGTFEAAKAAGLDPITDAGALYALRTIVSRRALAQKSFNVRVKELYGNAFSVDAKGNLRAADDAIAKLTKRGLSETQARRTLSEITYMGDGVYSRETSEVANQVLRGFDKVQSLMKRSATVYNPAFAFKQIVGNTVQTGLALPLRAGTVSGFFDPRVWRDSISAILGNDPQHAIKTVLGETIDGVRLRTELFENGIIRNMTAEGVSSGANSVWGRAITKGVQEQSNRLRLAKTLKKTGLEERRAETVAKIINGSLNYMNFPGIVEDTSRSMLYINARRGGYSAGEAAKMVQDGLFDYAHGLTKFETRTMKRLIPFYSYQRFAYELLGKSFLNSTGKFFTSGKVFDQGLEAIGSALGGEELSDAQRAAIPGWLLEQPSAVAGFNDQMRLQIATFNSFMPLDILTFATTDLTEDGKEEGVARWLEKSILAQLTPFIKVPIETVLTKRVAFTGRSLENTYTGVSDEFRLRDAGPEEFITSLASAVVGAGGSSQLAALAGISGVVARDLEIPEARKLLEKFMGFETRPDPKTGKDVNYINAYAMHMLSSWLPGMNHALRPFRTVSEVTPLQSAMSFLFGVHTQSVDLKQSAARKLGDGRREIARRRAELRTYALRDDEARYDEALRDLREYAETFGQEAELLAGNFQGGVR